jgi:hypothetical protein
LTEALFYLLSVDEALAQLSTQYNKKIKKLFLKKNNAMTFVENRLWKFECLIWEAINRIVMSSAHDISSTSLPMAYADRIERYFSIEG